MNKRSGYDNPFIADTYDYVVPYRDRKDVDFFVDLARESNGPVLELGCGTGRILIPTARAGIEVCGVDLSSEMLRVCRKSLSRESPEIQNRVVLQQSDMRNYAIDRSFCLAAVPFRAFHHLITVDDQIACLDCTRRHLRSGGRLALDLFNPFLPYLYDKRFLEVIEDEPSFTLPDGRVVARRSRLVSRNLYNQVITIEFLYKWKDAEEKPHKQTHRFEMRYLFRYEIEHLLARAGFTLETIYADYKKSPFGSQYPGELIVVARKS